MGALYRGLHLNLEIDVAVKCLKAAAVGEDPGSIARFQREATTAARIHGSPNLIHVFDVKSAHRLHYIVMEYIDGETVEDRVRRKGPLGAAEACAITLAATEGLVRAHAAGVVHRDIKPPNIMVSREGLVKLTDLGIAKSTTAEDTLVTMPNTQTLGHHATAKKAIGTMNWPRSTSWSSVHRSNWMSVSASSTTRPKAVKPNVNHPKPHRSWAALEDSTMTRSLSWSESVNASVLAIAPMPPQKHSLVAVSMVLSSLSLRPSALPGSAAHSSVANGWVGRSGVRSISEIAISPTSTT